MHLARQLSFGTLGESHSKQVDVPTPLQGRTPQSTPEFWSQPCAFKSSTGGSIELLPRSRDMLQIMTLTLHCSKWCYKGKLLTHSVKPWENAKHKRGSEETADCLFFLLVLKALERIPLHSKPEINA